MKSPKARLIIASACGHRSIVALAAVPENPGPKPHPDPDPVPAGPSVPPTVASESNYRRRIMKVLLGVAIIGFSVALVEFTAAAILGSMNLVYGGAIAALVGLSMLLTWREFQQGRDATAAGILTVALFLGAAGYTIAVPGSIPSLALLPVIVVALSMPLLHPRALRRLSLGAWTAGVTLIAVNTLLVANSALPTWFTVAFRVSAFAAVLGVALILLAQYHNRLRESMQQTQENASSLVEANHKLQEMDLLRTRFLNTAAHELRTPMTPMVIQLSLLRNGRMGEFTEKQQRAVEMVERNINRLNVITEDLLDVSRMQSDRMRLDKSYVHLDPLLDEVAGSLQDVAEAQGVQITLSRPDKIQVHIDKNRITQVLYNLVWNAVKFTSHGGRIDITAHCENGSCEIRITDTGIGIETDELPLLFQPFSQLRQESRDKQEGAGLGLFISRGIVEAHGGRIWAQSDGTGKGTTFTFTLPLADAPPPSTSRSSPPSPAPSALRHKPSSKQ